jgi:hypothetical protein
MAWLAPQFIRFWNLEDSILNLIAQSILRPPGRSGSKSYEQLNVRLGSLVDAVESDVRFTRESGHV